MKNRYYIGMIKRVIILFIIVALVFSSFPVKMLNGIKGTENVEAATVLGNPRIEADSSLTAGQKVTWDYIWFGSYPQIEIVDKPETSCIYEDDGTEISDYEVNKELYSSLQDATKWDNCDNITIQKEKYKRITVDNKYHYYKYQPIKWRILNTTPERTLLLSEQILDRMWYAGRFWGESRIRDFLNGGAGQAPGWSEWDHTIDNFYDNAFTKEEQSIILTTELDNNSTCPQPYGGPINEPVTNDKVFLLATYDLYSTIGESYGFSFYSDTYDDGRKCNMSTYAKSKEHDNDWWSNLGGWWLRSHGSSSSSYAATVESDGRVYWAGAYKDTIYAFNGVRPALYINLSTSSSWSYAGTVSSDGTVNEVAPEEGGGETDSDDNFNYDYSSELDKWLLNKGTMNSIQYLAKNENFLCSLAVSKYDDSFADQVSGSIINLVFRGTEGWKEILTGDVSREQAREIMAALLETYHSDIQELAIAETGHKFANIYIDTLNNANWAYFVENGLSSEEIRRVSDLCQKDEMAEYFVKARKETGAYATIVEFLKTKGGYSANSDVIKCVEKFQKSKQFADSLSNSMKILGSGLKTISLSQKTINYLYDIEELVCADEMFSEMLLYVKGHCTYTPVKQAADDLYSVIHGGYLEKLNYTSTELKNALDDGVLDAVIDASLKALAKSLPYAELLKISYDFGVGISNLVFHTGDTQKQMENMKCVAYIGNSLKSWLINNQMEYLNTDGAMKAEFAKKTVYAYYLLLKTRLAGEESLRKMLELSWRKYKKEYTLSLETTATLESNEQWLRSYGTIDSLLSSCIACPVDVELYNSTGDLVKTIEDGKEEDGYVEGVYYCSRYQPLEDDYVKILRIPENSGYIIKCIGKDLGLVDYSMSTITEQGVIDRKEAANIPVQKDTEMSVDNTNTVEPVVQVIEDNKVIGDYQAVKKNNYIPVESLSVSKAEEEIIVGKNKRLDVQVLPANASLPQYNFFSEDSSVLSVNSDGVLSGLKAGSTKVIISSADKEEIKKTILVAVVTKEQKKALEDAENAIKNINEDDLQSIKLAREKYDALDESQKERFDSDLLKKLENAEAAVKSDGNKDNAPFPEKQKDESDINDNNNKNLTASPDKVTKSSKDQTADNKKAVVNSIKLSGISHKIAMGKKIKLTAKILPQNATNMNLKWSSSNKKIATVSSSGVVKIKRKSAGKTVKIFATALDGSGKKAVWKIKVMKGVVTGLSVNSTKLSVKAGKSIKLKVIVKATKGANKNLQWVSSNPKLATVNGKGVVKALKAGKGKTVKITARATDGSGVKKVVKVYIN